MTEELGSSLVRMEALNDAANCLRLKDRHFLIHELESLQQEFPQVFFCVFLGILPPQPTLPETSFWLLNHAAFPSQEGQRLNEYAALLMIDPVAKCAGLNVGYALETLIPQKELSRILAAMRTPLWHGEFAGAVSQALRLLAKALRKAGKRAPKRQEFRPPDAERGFLQATGLETLRAAAAPKTLADESPPAASAREPDMDYDIPPPPPITKR
ncbi:MAG TPA: TPM domain-containing protein [Candidatus Saccharimonadia bacterium]|nr:TPM domain-containing protein [Candidatus Saccharimonadia bacterium]